LFFDWGAISAVQTPIQLPSEVATIVAGVIQDGGGLIFVGGKIIRVPPNNPWVDVLHAIAAMDSVSQMRDSSARNAMAGLQDLVANVAAKHGF
jgi:hypothetical protein